ncbi:hypothetical protein [Mycobacterium shigaense]|uniref:Uncharacterized protein n=1 Tax=Mycobacterium shigaense TaxID=722731 RepID=A0A1Z4EIP9_9MYCO|nr:hypothetical protein [Mycobacterium shigaense]MEA1123592.1 hypothetical protein [Mycobacterium shigaense]PRI13726.1 hypothetical protein B2J96_18890 [Mycobacterium shigaense]BAX92853.1 hypothetical protein MSG_02709 [Mycobacterium shigaense]
MKSPTKMTMMTFSGAAALAFAVGFGGVGPTPVANKPNPPTSASAHVVQARAEAGSTGSLTQHAEFVGCISDLNC